MVFNAKGIGDKNRYDKKGRQHGKWVVFWDDSLKNEMTVGKYRHGNPVGKWTYFSPLGRVQKKEIHRRKKIKIWFYHPNQQLESKGRAYIVNEKDGLHFYFQGKWKYYNDAGRLIKITTYYKGQNINEKLIP